MIHDWIWLVASNMAFIFHFIYIHIWDNPWDVILPIDFHSLHDISEG
jgi:hypothetical protein